MNVSREARVCVFGDLLYDCFVWADRLPRVGETVTGFRNGFFAGGKGGNQAVAAARLGARTTMLGKIGQDSHGEFLRGSLRESHIEDAGVLSDSEHPTGTCCVHVDRKGDNAIIVVPLANESISADDTDRMIPFIRDADVFLCQLQTNLDAVERCLRAARDAGVMTVLNPAPAKPGAEQLFHLADYITPNETEAESFSRCPQGTLGLDDWCGQSAAALLRQGARRVVITLGKQGSYYSDGAEVLRMPPFPVDAVDSTAAGDAFNAAFAIQMALGAGIGEALRYANAAGAVAASRHGSRPSLPTREDVLALMARTEQPRSTGGTR